MPAAAIAGEATLIPSKDSKEKLRASRRGLQREPKCVHSESGSGTMESHSTQSHDTKREEKKQVAGDCRIASNQVTQRGDMGLNDEHYSKGEK